jgi:hypothetical protein
VAAIRFNLKKGLIWLIALLILQPLAVFAAKVITATSASYADVSAAIAKASTGDTVMVPAGRATWSDPLVITKGINLVGAGINKTIITSNTGSAFTRIVQYNPTNPKFNEPFRLSGFTFDGQGTSGLLSLNCSALYYLSHVRIDHNSFLNCPNAFMKTKGQIYGVIDNNYFTGDPHIDFYGYNSGSWTYHAFYFGSANQLYFEDNVFETDGCINTVGIGGRVCIRYNTFTFTGGNVYPIHDMHGNQPGGNAAGMGCEIYENTYNAGTRNSQWWGMRGGKSLVYNNQYIGGAYSVYGNYREEYIDSAGVGPAFHAITGQPMHVSDSYCWNNMQGTKRIEPRTTEVIDYKSGQIIDGVFYPPMEPYRVVPAFDNDVWKQVDSFDGSTGMGVGLLAARPASCALEGAGYWATDTNTLYRWHDGKWETHYRPFTYPHPLRIEMN